MPTSFPLFPLRKLLLIDAATCAVMGLVLDVGALPLASLTGLPAAVLLYAGIGLFPIALFMAATAWRPHPAAVGLVIAGNAAWVAGSLALLLPGWLAPTASGVAFVLVQALAVAVLAWLEFGALRAAARPQAA